MKRAIGFLATLMFAFVVSFGFVVNSASAAPTTCNIDAATPCKVILKAKDSVDVFFDNGEELNIIYRSLTARYPVQISQTIGATPLPSVNLQPGQITTEAYPTGGATTAFFTNDAAVVGADASLIIRLR
ncbi:hypothetical protein [Dolichospermum circinale]|uniref:hypothetical protein n=1 Tax=Dolichospermum circinale TaxID=109265 RepID=UPI00232E0599|nr:hypothetical protein [Dolichospermum circinale]MDB9466090.1 hypothetical protein [Dolichospermum circinale CS-539/09]MDB9470946.1 hypothetical protein [Dolichospermum circinale CS-539]